jgi:hypothetical protein
MYMHKAIDTGHFSKVCCSEEIDLLTFDLKIPISPHLNHTAKQSYPYHRCELALRSNSERRMAERGIHQTFS